MSGGYVDTSILPDELVVEILSRVLVKDLMRYRCVSKFWNSLPFDPTFIKLHFQRSPRDTPIIFMINNMITNDPYCPHRFSSVESLLENPLSAFDDGGVPFKSTYLPIGCCNGLVCMRSIGNQDGTTVTWVRFWNPATRFISRKSPLLETPFGNIKIGFGCDDSTNTYKVVAIVHGGKKLGKPVLKVYSMGDHSWRNIALSSETNSNFPVSILQHKGEYLNGTLNWVAKIVSSQQYVVFSFDLWNETYNCLALHDGMEFGDGQRFVELGVFRGHICVSLNQNGTHYAIWQMNQFRDENSWTQLVNVSYDLLPFPLHHFPHPLCISADGDELLLLNNRNHQLIRYNRTNNIVEHFTTPGKCIMLNSTDYVQSLVLPYRIRGSPEIQLNHEKAGLW